MKFTYNPNSVPAKHESLPHSTQPQVIFIGTFEDYSGDTNMVSGHTGSGRKNDDSQSRGRPGYHSRRCGLCWVSTFGLAVSIHTNTRKNRILTGTQLASIRQQFELNLICAKEATSSSPELVSYGDGKLKLSWETPSACETALDGSDDTPPANEKTGGGGFLHFLSTMFWLIVVGLFLYFAFGECEALAARSLLMSSFNRHLVQLHNLWGQRGGPSASQGVLD